MFFDDYDTVYQLIVEAMKAAIAKRGGEFKPSQMVEKAARWACMEKRKSGLMFYGGVGNGKTTIAHALCDVFNWLGGTKFARVSAVELTRRYSAMQETFINQKTAPCLFIDDLGCEEKTVKIYGTTYSPIIDVLTYRYERNLMTIVTTNFGEKELAEYYDIRIYDRMKEMFNRVAFTQESFRKL
ncbi:MAG: AAA family ATPase [Lentimicrobiaceae bacterium]|nr:AAA family ATPase [Lentimicrobiaceae bacterium]